MSIIRKIMTLALLALPLLANAQKKDSIGTIVDEVVWVVGDDAILKSDVEKYRSQFGSSLSGNPYCVIPEELAIQKLFIHQAAIDSIEVSDADISTYVEEEINNRILLTGSKEKLERVNRMMSERETEGNGFIPVGESEQGLKNIVEWYQEHPVEVLRIIDPFFHAEDLYIIKSLMDLNNDLRCYILTLNKKDASLNEVFQNGWNAISSNLPGRIEVKSCCFESDQKISPIHDRWWLLYDTENDQYYGKRMASPSVMGARITEMSDMDEQAINETLKLWEKFFNNMVQKIDERKLKYDEALLRG